MTAKIRLQLLTPARGVVEADALENGCVAVRLEIRRDNKASLGLFESLG